MPEANLNNNETLPAGKYTLASVDIDTTGRRLIDEIVQLAVYSPKSQYEQYIIPIMNLNPAARQRHQIRVITVGFFRMLKSMQTYRVLKTKTEIVALNNFLDWIENLKKEDEGSLGVILIYHEQRKFIPCMILEAMRKYGLLERFLNSVKSFADGLALSESKCGSTIKYFNVGQLSKVLLNKETVTEKEQRYEFEGNASVRAKNAYQVVEHLVKTELKDVEKPEEMADDLTENMLTMIREYASPTQRYINELDSQNKCMDRQNSLRSVFVNYFKITLYHRVKAVTFRRILADNGYDLESLQEIWVSKKREGITELVGTLDELKELEKTELVDLLDSFFDPDKQAIQPVVKRHRSKRGQKENAKPRHNGDGGDHRTNPSNNSSPDSSTVKKNSKPSRNRRRKVFNGNNEIHKEEIIQQTTAATIVAVN